MPISLLPPINLPHARHSLAHPTLALKYYYFCPINSLGSGQNGGGKNKEKGEEKYKGGK
jgi:hypothetical protein